MVEYHKDCGVDPVSGIGCHARMLHYFEHLWQASNYRKELTAVERVGAQVREATRDDFWELAQEYFTLASDSCAQQNYKRATFFSARATAFVEMAAGRVSTEMMEQKYHELLYAVFYEPKGDSDG